MIYVTADLYRPHACMMHNLKTLFDFIAEPIARATGKIPRLLKANSDCENLNLWLKEKIPEPHFLPTRQDLVIGFEMNQRSVDLFERNKIPYINISTHPIRFCDDIFWGFRSNAAYLHFKEDYFYEQARNLNVKPSLNLPDNSAIIVGQTLEDGSVIKKGKFRFIGDFIPTCELFLETDQPIFYKPHPYQMTMIKDIPSISDNIYSLLKSPQVTSIVTLSSSVFYEAKYFNKEAFSLLLQDKNMAQPLIHSDLINPNFWEELIATKQYTTDFGKVVKNQLRQTLNEYWGYSK